MKRGQRGQTLVEMAMISPFLIMILLMMIDGGRAAYAYGTLAGAAPTWRATTSPSPSNSLRNQPRITKIK